MASQWIDIPSNDGKSFNGYLALPPAGKGPGLVLVQEIWGVNRHIRAVAEQYALDGYVVLAPDVFWRQEKRIDLDYNEADSAKAFALVKAADAAQCGDDVAAAVDHLRGLSESNGRVAVMGFCFGGQLAYRAAATGKPDTAVSYYGGGIHNHLDLAKEIHQPILFHFAGEDGMIPPEAVNRIRDTFADHSRALVFEYPGVDHGFNCWGRSAYNQHAAALAHGRTLQFLAENLN
ncbi:carboxymethylenebutenolidase [Marinobacter daqiaonensis]|uniref:Carboxymethylenebutenolidase n=1 Tax=Marinobacter daqiaonensis TaxID=650891 RepID=A0A1I6I528_9GAMM|nr:dienelactone hydrolase family protein [Marinobacter daqiaonensis]SFR61769.1 carboxymethylenebutenolidase [Marinobacter daqiaonensis]